jgi:Flp pilus assembly secretin CpaC
MVWGREGNMTRRTLIPIAPLMVVIATLGAVTTDRALAAEPQIAVVSSDATSRFLVLGLNKSLVIDLPKDVKDVLIADEKTVKAVVRSKRRVYVIGTALGQTNVFFFDADGREIGGLDIAVRNGSPPASLENNALPAKTIVVYSGTTGGSLSCTPDACVGPDKPDTTTYTDTTYHNLNH